MTEWKDETIYSRGDKERKLTTFTIVFGSLRLTITSNHIHDRGNWCMHFRPFYDTHFLNRRAEEFTVEQAKSKALELAREALSRAHSEMIEFENSA